MEDVQTTNGEEDKKYEISLTQPMIVINIIYLSLTYDIKSINEIKSKKHRA